MNVKPKSFRLITRAAAVLLIALFTTATAWAETVTTNYVDADGTTHTGITATVLTGGETTLGTNDQTTWYVVNSDVSAKISCYGNVHLILADGKTLTAHNSDNNMGHAIWGAAGSTLTIYGQTLGTGVLNASTAATNTILFNGDVFIHGGIVNVSSQVGSAISVMNITINGGIVTATGSSYGINATGTITLGGGTVTSNGGYRGTVTVALPDFYIYSDGNGHYYSGTLSDEQKAAIAGQTLRPTTDPAHFADNGDDTYTIHTAGGWNVFCDLLAENAQDYFTDKTVQLGADITVTSMAGSEGHAFTGTFNGGGHTLTVSISSSDGNAAPFREIMGATIRNLKVSGTVSGHKHSAGLVSYARGADSSVENTIENCLVATAVSTIVNTDGDCYLGGIVGHGFNCKLTIRGCAFTGSLTSPHNYTGGLQGWSDGNTLILENDIFAASSVNAANVGFHPIAIHANNKTTTATVSNVYYTVAPTCTQATRIATANAAEQPKQARSITAGQWVTIEAVALTGDATQYTVSGITAYANGGLQRGTTLYYGSDDQLSLTLSNSATGAPQGYQYGYTASAGTLSGSTLNMPDADVTVNVDTETLRSTGEPVEVSYVDAGGNTRTHDAIALDGHEAVDDYGDVNLAAGWYFVGLPTVAFDHRLNLRGDVNLILADGKTMTTTSSNEYSIDASFCSLTIYGQTLGTGTLNVAGNNYGIFNIYNGNLTIIGGTVNDYHILSGANTSHDGTVTISGGTVTCDIISARNGITISGGTVTATSDYGDGISTYSGNITISGGRVNVTGRYGIYADSGNITISGGSVNATGTSYGIYSGSGTITLGCTTTSDFIKASSYLGGILNIADGQVLTDGSGHFYSGTLSTDDITAIAGQTLRPADLVEYIDADGQPAQHGALKLDGTETTLNAGWYYVGTDISYSSTIYCNGKVNIILADGCTMNVTTNNANGIEVYDDGSLTIYGQDNGTGTLEVFGHFRGIYTDSGNITIYGGTVATDGWGEGINTESGDITISGGTVNATGDIKGINTESGDITISGGKVTATGGPNDSGIYSGSGTITLGCTTASDYIYASSYFGTVKVAEGQALTDGSGHIYSGTLSAADIEAIAGQTLLPVLTQYIDANGQPAQHVALKLDGTETTLGKSNQETWYFVGLPTVAFDHTLTLNGDVHLILADGCTMNVTGSISNGIDVNGTLTIYGQTDGTGTLNATSDYEAGIITGSGNITISGGTVTATGIKGIHIDSGNITISGGRVTATGGNGAGISTNYGTITISGGRVTATGSTGIFTFSGTITLGCTTTSDFIKVSSYGFGPTGGTLNINGELFDEYGNSYSGTYYYNVPIPDGATLRLYDCRLTLADNADNTTAINEASGDGKQYAVTLQGRTLYKDGSWNTLCLPFNVTIKGSVLDGDDVEVKTLTSSAFEDGTLTLNFSETSETTLTAGTPYIIRWTQPEDYEAIPSAYDLVNPVFTGVTVSSAPAATETVGSDYVDFVGTYQPASIFEDGTEKHNLYLGTENKLYYPTAAGITVNAFRGYFRLKNGLTAGDPASGVRAFVLNFGDDETTGIVSAEANSSLFTLHSSLSEWYTLDGRKLSGKPTRRGLYIHNGIKVVIK